MLSSFAESLRRAVNAVRARRAVMALAATAMVLLLACAHSVDTGDGDTLLFDNDAGTALPQSVCIQTDCPAPWATCGNTGLCTTNTNTDLDACGSCENACDRPGKSQHATAVCTGGKCSIACEELYGDCNMNPADGCETELVDDPNNCGGCGVKCDAGVLCWLGACGCPGGDTQCAQDCVDLTSDNKNCGACGKLCLPPTSSTDPAWTCGPNVSPPNTTWQCATSACSLQCQPPYADCDNDFCGDGCETNTESDPKNCGACGKTCDAGQACVDGACICPAGTTRCGDSCVDLNVDPLNCGTCDNECDGPSGFDGAVGGSPSCSGGVCGYVCYAGYRDCNGKIFDGCEVNVAQDPKHCGDCTTQCDTAAGQPCVDGVCLTKKCDPPKPVN